jgi:adenylate cyclase
MAPLVSLERLRSFFVPDRAVVRPGPYGIMAAAGAALGLAIGFSDAGQRFEWHLYDRYLRLQASGAAPAPGVVVIAIDEPSFAEIGMPWPWPRSLHASLIERLVEGGATSIVFDIVFDVPATSPEDDAALADAIGRAGNVVLAADQAVIEDRGYALTQWSEPLPLLARGAAGIGFVRIPYDPDGVLRRTLLTHEGRPLLPLAAAALEPRFSTPAGIDTSQPHLFRFNGAPRRGVTTVSYYQALDARSALPTGIFENKHVVIGRALAVPTIDEQADHFTTPVALRMAGGEVHATILDALLRDRFIDDPFAAPAALLALCIVTAAAASVALYFAGPIAALTMAFATAAVLLGVGYLSLARDLRLPVMTPAITMLSAYGATAAYRFALVTRERRLIKRAFQHYVAPAIVERMLDDPSKLKLGGEEYEVSVLFSDLEGFTSLSEHLTPAELSSHLGEYFTEMLDVLLPHGGTLDKLIGDAIMMYFGCPVPDARHAAQACRGALAMQQRMVAVNDKWRAESLPQLRTRIGINTGRAVAGNMGTKAIFNYSLLGDCVNLASRLEGVNKEYGTRTIIGEDTWKVVRDEFDTRELDWIRVKGRSRPVAIYELVAEAGGIDGRLRETFARFAEGLRLYRAQRWADATVAFERALRINPEDGPSRLFAERCAYYGAHAPDAWDGVHVMHAK